MTSCLHLLSFWLVLGTTLAQLTLGPDTTLVVLQKDRTTAFNLALRDIEQDFYSALGRTPVVLSAGL